MFNLIIASFILGIVFCAPPGVVTAEATRRGITHGFAAALKVELGSLIGDAVWAIIGLVGIAFLVQLPLVQSLIGIFGVFFLGRLSWSAFKDAWKGGMPNASERSGLQGDFVTGATLSLSNPYAVAFWLSIGGSFLVQYIPRPTAIHYVIFFVAFMLAATLYCFFFSGLIAWGRRFINADFFRVVNLICGVAIAYFAFNLLHKLAQHWGMI